MLDHSFNVSNGLITKTACYPGLMATEIDERTKKVC